MERIGEINNYFSDKNKLNLKFIADNKSKTAHSWCITPKDIGTDFTTANIPTITWVIRNNNNVL